MSDRLQQTKDAEVVAREIRQEIRALKRENKQPKRLIIGDAGLYLLGYIDRYVDGAKFTGEIPEGAIGQVFGLWVYRAPKDQPGYLRVDDQEGPPFRPLGKEQATFYALQVIKEQFDAAARAGLLVQTLAVSGPVLAGLLDTRSLFKWPMPPDRTLASGAAGFLVVEGNRVEVFEMRPGSYRDGEFRVEVSAAKPEEDPIWTDV